MSAQSKIAVVGAGTMGAGIAQISVQSGFDTLLYDISQEFIDKGLNRIKGFVQRSREKGRISVDEERQILARLHGTLRLEEFHPVGYWALISDPDGHTLELSFGQEVGFSVEKSKKNQSRK